MSININPSKVPPEPDWSSIFGDELDIIAAHDYWDTIIAEMQEVGTLSLALAHSIKSLVEFMIQYNRAAQHVAELGPLLKGKRAKIGQWNPYWTVMRQASQMVSILESSLGIAPTSRKRAAPTGKTNGQKRKADAYIRPLKAAA